MIAEKNERKRKSKSEGSDCLSFPFFCLFSFLSAKSLSSSSFWRPTFRSLASLRRAFCVLRPASHVSRLAFGRSAFCLPSSVLRLLLLRLQPLSAHLGESFRRPVFGEVQASVLAAMLDRREVVGAGRVELLVEHAQPDALALVPEARVVLVRGLAVADALEAGFRVDVSGAVPLIFPGGAEAEVVTAVVQAVAVLVVHDHALGRIHDVAVHENVLIAHAAGGVPAATEVPVVPAEPFVIRGIYVGVQAFDQLDRLYIPPSGVGGLGR